MQRDLLTHLTKETYWCMQRDLLSTKVLLDMLPWGFKTCCHEAFRHAAMRPKDMLLWGLKTCCYEALRHATMRPKDILLWGLKTSCYEALPVVDQGAVGHALEVLKREALDMLQQPLVLAQLHLYTSAYVSIRLHTSAYVSIRQHTCFSSRICLLSCTCVKALLRLD